MPPSVALEQAAQAEAHAAERQPAKHECQTTITLKKGEEATRNNQKLSSYFAFHNQLPATPCSGP
jgi:hypothetical protein